MEKKILAFVFVAMAFFSLVCTPQTSKDLPAIKNSSVSI